MHELSPYFKVPANSSRFFVDYDEAVSQNLGTIHLVHDFKDNIVINESYAPELIKYDSQYCTSVSDLESKYSIPTLTYIDLVLDKLRDMPTVIDIGCGQGELVFELRDRGVNAWGFDPVLRKKSPFLQSRYWNPSEAAADLYVMRCVLPHIQKPWEFLAQIAISSPSALVLIEFQRVEWILEHKVWYQISHDHVNLFSISDFVNSFSVIESGTFSKGEWGWVLVNLSKYTDLGDDSLPSYIKGFGDLFSQKHDFLNQIQKIDYPIALWGSAGKGIVLAHAIQGVHENLIAIDADSHRWGLYLEASGVKVKQPPLAIEQAEKGTLILVCNPNHVEQVKNFVKGKFEVKLPIQI